MESGCLELSPSEKVAVHVDFGVAYRVFSCYEIIPI